MTVHSPNATTLKSLRTTLKKLSDPDDAAFLQRYFKTAPGEYGAGDKFLGVRVPQLRRLARENRRLTSTKVISLLHSRWHEERLLALLILVEQTQRAGIERQREIRDHYLDNTAYINNWDLVDCSALHIVGPFVMGESYDAVVTLAHSNDLWERRIAIMSTFYCIRQHHFEPTLEIAEKLQNDPHDLIHKAVGWMLREVGNRDRRTAESFLKPRYTTLPRTLLRYAIEKYPESLRKRYLHGKI